jgi:hypothetical protein
MRIRSLVVNDTRPIKLAGFRDRKMIVHETQPAETIAALHVAVRREKRPIDCRFHTAANWLYVGVTATALAPLAYSLLGSS